MREIKLTQDKIALVDDEDFMYLNAWKWHASQHGKAKNKWYAIRHAREFDGKRIRVRMHRQIMNLEPHWGKDPRIVHHKDDDGLNNQKSNLEILASVPENNAFITNWRNKKKPEEPWL